MGYCYDYQHRLCCDYCGEAGGVRKFRCPFGYCPAVAACQKCRKEHAPKFGKAAHREYGCERRSQECQQRQDRAAELKAWGYSVRCSALGTGDGRVHVLFRDQYGNTEGYYMAKAVYDSIPLLEPAIPEHYDRKAQELGLEPLQVAPDTFQYGATTKQVGAI